MMRFLILSTITVSLAGCGSAPPTGDVVKVAPASGVLSLKGQPLEFYQVATFPQDGRPAVGITDAEGKFVLGTNQEGDGATPGTHKIAVTWIGPPSTNPGEGMTEFTPPPPPKVKIADKYGNPETSGLTLVIPDAGASDLKVDLQ